MIKPTPKQITDYAKSIGFNLDGEEFFDHYEMNGWTVKPRTPMCCWKATVRTWKRMRLKWSGADTTLDTKETTEDEFELLRKMGV